MKMKSIAEGCIISILLMIMLSGCGLFSQKIDLEKYIVWNCQGINGYASMELALQVDQMQSDFDEKIGNEEKKKAFYSLLEGMTITGNQEENLSNEDVVVIHVDYDEALCKKAGVRIAGNDQSVTVTGLEEGQLVDLFAGIEVQVTGVAPFATAQVINRSEDPYMKNLVYTVEPSQGFERGAQLQVSCNADKEGARAFGYVYVHDTKGISTTDIDYYVKHESDLDASILSLLAGENYKTIVSESESTVVRMLYKLTNRSNYLFQYNKEWVDRMNLKEIKLLTSNDYVLSKEQNQPVNRLYLIWEGYVTNADYGSDAYFCFAYNNVIRQGDGTFVVRHDQPELRYICSDSYDAIMEQINADNNGQYTQQQVSTEGVSWLSDPADPVESEENGEKQEP